MAGKRDPAIGFQTVLTATRGTLAGKTWTIMNPLKGEVMVETPLCLTPGAQYHISISQTSLCAKVDFGRSIDLDNKEAILLETITHDALELVLSKYYAPGSRY